MSRFFHHHPRKPISFILNVGKSFQTFLCYKYKCVNVKHGSGIGGRSGNYRETHLNVQQLQNAPLGFRC